MIIDMHSHWVPRGLVAAASVDRTWYGWRVLRDPNGAQHIALGDRSFPLVLASGGLENAAARIRQRTEEQGIDMEVLMIAGHLWNYHLNETESIAFCREVNAEVAEVQGTYPTQFRGLGILPMQHRKIAAAELEHAVKEWNIRAFAIASNVGSLPLDDPTILPVLELAAEADVSISVHPPAFGTIGEERFPRYHFANSFGAPLESSMAVMSVVYSGLLDRYPGIRIFFTQGGGWIHYGVGRFDLRYYQRPDARPMMSPPSDYLRRMYYDCLVHDDQALDLLVKRVGDDHVVLGTDYPFRGDIRGGAPKWIQSRDFLSVQGRERILWRNAASFLGLDSDPTP